MSNLSIVSFHNSTGAVLNIATIAANSRKFLPMIVGSVADCCPCDIRSDLLQLELGFVTFVPKFVDSKILKVMYYLDLTQTSIDVSNGANVVNFLVTFHDAADLRTVSINKI